MFLFITALIFMFISKLRFPKKVAIVTTMAKYSHFFAITVLNIKILNKNSLK